MPEVSGMKKIQGDERAGNFSLESEFNQETHYGAAISPESEFLPFPGPASTSHHKHPRKSCPSTGRSLQVSQGTAGHTHVDQIWLPGVMVGLNGFTLEAAANLPSKPHPSLQPGILQVTVIFQFTVIHVVVSEFSGTISTLC